MTRRSRIVQGIAAGIGIFLVNMWPVFLIGWAGTSGSVGDLSQVRFLGVSTLFAVALSCLGGWLMALALDRAQRSPRIGRLDPWGAYALGIGVYELALTAVPAIMYGLLLADENQSLRSREWLVYLLWIGGNIAAALLSFAAARALLRPGLRSEDAAEGIASPDADAVAGA
jgi:hypothetical protein